MADLTDFVAGSAGDSVTLSAGALRVYKKVGTAKVTTLTSDTLVLTGNADVQVAGHGYTGPFTFRLRLDGDSARVRADCELTRGGSSKELSGCYAEARGDRLTIAGSYKGSDVEMVLSKDGGTTWLDPSGWPKLRITPA